MSINWGMALGSIGSGMAHGIATVKKEQQDKEQLDYDRNRQAEVDRQNLEKHNQLVKQNDYVLQDTARKAADIQRRENLGRVIGQYQQFQQNGDIDSALKTYTENANSDNLGNPNWDQNHKLTYSKGNDGLYSLDIIDKNTGSLIKTAKNGITIDDLISNTYSQIDPLGTYEGKISAQAKTAEEKRKNEFELNKLKTEHGYKIDEKKTQGNIDAKLAEYKYDNEFNLEGLRQQGSYDRASLQQENENYRAGLKNGGGTNAITPMNLAAITVGAESKGQHFGANGQLLPSYDPKSSARGAGQFTQGTRDYVLKASGIDAYKSADDALKATAWYQQNNQSKLGGNAKAGFIAHYAGPGEVQGWMRKAQEQGISWESLIPAKYQERARLFDQHFGGSTQQGSQYIPLPSQQNSQSKTNAFAVATNNQINAVSSAMTTELGLEGKKNAAVIGGLSGAQTQVVRFVNSTSYSERANAFNAVYSMVDRVVGQTEVGATMPPQARSEYVLQKSAELIGARNKIEIGQYIRAGTRGSKAQHSEKTASQNIPEFDFSNISVSDVPNNTPSTKPKAKEPATKPVPNPLYSQGAMDALKGSKQAFIPYKNTAKNEPKTKGAPAPTAYSNNMNKYTNNPFS